MFLIFNIPFLITVVNHWRGQIGLGLHAFFATVNVTLENMAYLQEENGIRTCFADHTYKRNRPRSRTLSRKVNCGSQWAYKKRYNEATGRTVTAVSGKRHVLRSVECLIRNGLQKLLTDHWRKYNFTHISKQCYSKQLRCYKTNRASWTSLKRRPWLETSDINGQLQEYWGLTLQKYSEKI